MDELQEPWGSGDGEGVACMPKSDFGSEVWEGDAGILALDFGSGDGRSDLLSKPKSYFGSGDWGRDLSIPKSDFDSGDGKGDSTMPKSSFGSGDRMCQDLLLFMVAVMRRQCI